MSKKHWFYDHAGRVGGPVNVTELRHLAANGQILPTDQVRKEDMDRWVKAGAVKGLFAPAADSEPAFDFGAGPPPAAAAEEFNPAFDFFGGAAEASPATPARPSAPRRKSKAAPADGGTFRLTGPSNPPAESPDEAPIPYADFQADVPMATPVFEDEVPTAAPAVGAAVLTGPEVALQPYGTAAPTGGTVELSVGDGWLVARCDGQETHLRLACLDAVALRERSPAGLVLSVHAGGQVVAVRCDGDAEPVRVFVRRVLAAAG